MYLYRCVHSVSLTEHSVTIQIGDKRGGLLALDNLSTNQGRHSAAAPPIAPPAAPTSLQQYIYRLNPAMNSSIYLTSHNLLTKSFLDIRQYNYILICPFSIMGVLLARSYYALSNLTFSVLYIVVF